MPRVWNKRESNIPADAIYVGRPTKFGNPFRVGSYYNGKLLRQSDAVEQYRDWLLNSDQGLEIMKAAKAELKGKDLVCWCAPKPCHADILFEVANKE